MVGIIQKIIQGKWMQISPWPTKNISSEDLSLLASVSVEEEESEEREKSMRKQVTFCEEGKLTESLGASSWETDGRQVKPVTILLLYFVINTTL